MTRKTLAPKIDRKKQTRDKIVNAAMELLAEYDYSYLSVANICKVAHVSLGTFYHYFEGIDDLVRVFFVRAYAAYSEEQPARDSGNPLEDMKLFFRSYFKFCEQQGLEFVRHFYDPHNTSLHNQVNPDDEEHFSLPSLQETEHLIIEAQEQGLLRADADPLVIASDICTIEKGAMLEWCVSSGTADAVGIAERIIGGYLDSYRR